MEATRSNVIHLVILLGYYCVVETNSKRLQANTASALSAIARGSHVNQNLIASIPGAVKGLVELAASKNSVCQVKAASAIESLAQRNVHVQRLVEDAGAVRPLIRLLKIWSIEVKEQGNATLYHNQLSSTLVQRFLISTSTCGEQQKN